MPYGIQSGTIDATDIQLNAGVGGLGLGVPVQWGEQAFTNPLAASANPFALLAAGYGALNPSTTPGGSANPTAAITGISQPDPSQGGSTNPGQSVTGAARTPGSIADYFIRGVVIILGFIFVAVGLSMFRSREQ